MIVSVLKCSAASSVCNNSSVYLNEWSLIPTVYFSNIQKTFPGLWRTAFLALTYTEQNVMQDQHSAYNVTLRRVLANIVVVEKEYEGKYYTFWVCVCRIRYPACNVHALYCHLCPVRLCNIFPNYLINGTIFRKTVLNIKCVLSFSLQICLKHLSL
jgi:hypothetical protein